MFNRSTKEKKEKMRSEGKIRLENMDCLELLRTLPDNSIDLLLQDPPYNTTNCDWDVKINFADLWKEWDRVCKPNAAMVFTASQPFSTDLINSNRKYFRYELIWDKIRAAGFLNANRMPLKTHENILVFYKELPTYNPQKMDGRKYDKTKYNGSKLEKNVIGAYTSESSKNDGERFPVSIMVFSQDWTRQEQIHPTQKPIDLMRYLILTYSNEGDTIFDGYAGSSTIAMACIEENRNCICAEKETEYYELGKKRIDEALCQTKLF